MIAWLWKLIVGDFRRDCQHQWETLTNRDIHRYCRVRCELLTTGSLYVQQCKHCGTLKEFKTEV